LAVVVMVMVVVVVVRVRVWCRRLSERKVGVDR
jgi:hypothetical protein